MAGRKTAALTTRARVKARALEATSPAAPRPINGMSNNRRATAASSVYRQAYLACRLATKLSRTKEPRVTETIKSKKIAGKELPPPISDSSGNHQREPDKKTSPADAASRQLKV